jgi:hypothetical protein
MHFFLCLRAIGEPGGGHLLHQILKRRGRHVALALDRYPRRQRFQPARWRREDHPSAGEPSRDSHRCAIKRARHHRVLYPLAYDPQIFSDIRLESIKCCDDVGRPALLQRQAVTHEAARLV